MLRPYYAKEQKSRRKLFFGNDWDAELLRLGQLAAGVLARQNIARLFAHRAGCLSAVALNDCGGFLAGVVLQRAGQHEGLARKAAVDDALAAFKADARLAQQPDLML